MRGSDPLSQCLSDPVKVCVRPGGDGAHYSVILHVFPYSQFPSLASLSCDLSRNHKEAEEHPESNQKKYDSKSTSGQ